MAEEHNKPTVTADATIVTKLEKEMLQLIEKNKPLNPELLDTYLDQYGVPKAEAQSLFRYLLENKKEKTPVQKTLSEDDASTPDFAAPPRMTAATTPGLSIAPPRMTAQITGEMSNSSTRGRKGSDSSDGHEEFFSHDGVENSLVSAFDRTMKFENST